MTKLSVCLLLLVLAVVVVPSALADTVYDPGFGVGDPACQVTDTPLHTNAFPVMTFQSGNPNVFNFCNETGHTLFNIGGMIGSPTPLSAAAVICNTGGVFATCAVNQITANSISIFLAGGPGVPDFHAAGCSGGDDEATREDDDEGGCGHFFVNLNCPVGTACSNWANGTRFVLTANVPEPSAALLVGTGVVAFIRRKYGKRR